MSSILQYIKDYSLWVDKRIFVLSSLIAAIGIFINYYHHLNDRIVIKTAEEKYVTWYFILLASFSFPYMLQALFKNSGLFNNWRFVLLLLLAPAIFSWKLVYDVHFDFSENDLINSYWNGVVYWPFKLVIVTAALFAIWKVFEKDTPFYGLTTKNFTAKPYLIMLLVMVPLIAAAATQKDFLMMYPKLQRVHYLMTPEQTGWKILLYELAYGTDFFSIELFFRGFLVIAFARWAGKDAILPMAVFYCAIHFGKPLGECISSFFGGLILGIVTYHTRTIYGGLVVHLGIAWLMELGGYFGNLYFR